MTKHLKIILSPIKAYLIITVILVSCLELKYLKNKIIIKSFTIEKTESFLKLKFQVDYYSDSTITNYYADSMEKGLNGIDGEVVYFGGLSESFYYNDSCQYLKFKDIAKKINEEESLFEGQDLERLYHKVCIPLNLDSIDSNIVLIIKSNNSYDTIYNSLPDLKDMNN